MLSRAIMAPRDLILDTTEAQRIALFFDHILIYAIQRDKFTKEQLKQFETDFNYLRENDVALRCGLQNPFTFGFENDKGEFWDPFEAINKECDIVLPFHLGLGISNQVENEAHADRIVRHFSSQLMYDDSPVVAHANPSHLNNQTTEKNSIELILNEVPLPPTNLPWQDFIQFRKDEENIAKLRALRLWLNNRAKQNESPTIIRDELQHLLYEYQKYMAIQHKKYSTGVLSTLITSTPEIIGHLMTLNFGSTLNALFSVRGRSIALSEAELSAPGREVSYVANVKNFLKK